VNLSPARHNYNVIQIFIMLNAQVLLCLVKFLVIIFVNCGCLIRISFICIFDFLFVLVTLFSWVSLILLLLYYC
jgi:hypothetical protein